MPVVELDPTFVSAKTSSPVPYRGDLARLALIRATLDPEVAAIGPVPPGVGHEAPRDVAVATLVGMGGAVTLRVCARDGVAVPDPGMATLAYSASDLAADPLAANLVLVWSCARRWVPPGDQVRVLHLLDEEGSASLIDAAQAARSSGDGVATVLAMACRGLVGLDLDDAPLGPGTRVTRRPA